MLASVLPYLNSKNILLASQSPRRLEILTKNIGLNNIVAIASKFDENIDKLSCSGPEDYVMKTSLGKINDIIYRQLELPIKPDYIISADTIVVLHNKFILEKPNSFDEAVEMLSKLSGNAHQGFLKHIL